MCRTVVPRIPLTKTVWRVIKWCAYDGDVSAIRFLITQGESLESLGGEPRSE